MFKAPLTNPAQKRTLRPLYANHQATPWGGFLDPDWDRSFDIWPGTVMTRLYGEVFTPYTGAQGQAPFGLSALFVNAGGVEEVTGTGTNLFTVWVGDSQAAFEVLAPAFDTEADWPSVTGTGGRILLTGNAEGKLTPTGATADNVIAELIDVVSTDKIVVRLNRTGGAVAPVEGGS